jgi:hypothetical protein
LAVWRHSLDGRNLARGEAALLLIDLNQLPRGVEASTTVAVVTRAVVEGVELPLTSLQAQTLRTAVDRIRSRQSALPPGLARLEAQLTS